METIFASNKQRKCIIISNLGLFWLKLDKMCNLFNSCEESLHWGVWKFAKYVRNCVVFWKNLHSWQNFYTTAGRDGRDKFQVWKWLIVLVPSSVIGSFLTSKKTAVSPVSMTAEKCNWGNGLVHEVSSSKILARQKMCRNLTRTNQCDETCHFQIYTGTNQWHKTWQIQAL